MKRFSSIKKYAEQNPVLILAGVIVIVALGCVFVWHENQRQAYYASRQEACAQLALNQIRQSQKSDTENSNATIEHTPMDFYTYSRNADDCIFESIEETVRFGGSPDKSTVYYSFDLSGLFNGSLIAVASETIGTSTPTESEMDYQACNNFNASLTKYFDVYNAQALPCLH